MRVTVEVDGFTYQGRWLTNGTGGLHVRGPLEYQRQTRGFYRYGQWDGGPTGRCTERHYRWWRAARMLEELYDDYHAALDVLPAQGSQASA